MPAYTFIVSRQLPELLSEFLAQFDGSSEIAVIADRRVAQRRTARRDWPPERERRHADRRVNAIFDLRLAQAGYVMVAAGRAPRSLTVRSNESIQCSACR